MADGVSDSKILQRALALNQYQDKVKKKANAKLAISFLSQESLHLD